MKAVILSYALDTNGQNYRYVHASQRWGTDPGVLKALAIGEYDPAAVVGRFRAAAEKYDELRIRSVHRSAHIYQSMPHDIEWTRDKERLIRGLAIDADVIHLNNSWRPWQRLNLKIRRPMLLHHHGSLLRSQTAALLSWAKRFGAVQAVSTVDLMRYAPNLLHWLPTAYDIDWLEGFRARHWEDHDGIRVVSCPTNRQFKSTDALIQAVADLRNDGLNVELVVVEEKPWLEAMAIKATADIYFDQVQLGYGCNAVEAWGMGIPVIAGADAWTLSKMREVYGVESLPFYEATAATIGAAIADLATHKAKRTAYAKRGMAHVRRFHDERPALGRLAELYHRAIEDMPEHLGPFPAVTFTAATRQVPVAWGRLNFPLTTDNQQLANKVRLLAAKHPKYGIEEVPA